MAVADAAFVEEGRPALREVVGFARFGRSALVVVRKSRRGRSSPSVRTSLSRDRASVRHGLVNSRIAATRTWVYPLSGDFRLPKAALHTTGHFLTAWGCSSIGRAADLCSVTVDNRLMRVRLLPPLPLSSTVLPHRHDPDHGNHPTRRRNSSTDREPPSRTRRTVQRRECGRGTDAARSATGFREGNCGGACPRGCPEEAPQDERGGPSTDRCGGEGPMGEVPCGT